MIDNPDCTKLPKKVNTLLFRFTLQLICSKLVGSFEQNFVALVHDLIAFWWNQLVQPCWQDTMSKNTGSLFMDAGKYDLHHFKGIQVLAFDYLRITTKSDVTRNVQ
ncbi:hypothetical protein N7532_006995 [Penicillium argentinense]|uniref:Uncharacterized protein n=1 Tax=Penicillium argentinense TaxID=1131581 RepID=A0A9W9FH15_9EURO|nr:uncharacterized protein N7532_006995 [Penicillium argentinense]KAJ5099994.1 hypothetical protein N7532_006995 [Penicillium argentinense]